MPQFMPSLMQFSNFLLRNARETKNVIGNSLRNVSSLLRNARETRNVIGRTMKSWQL